MLVVAGTVCGFLVAGVVGEALAIGLVTIGLGAVLLLLFFEVGLSEDQERAREEQRRRERRPRHAQRRLRLPPRQRRP